VRAQEAFLAAHVAGAVNIPIQELERRTHELPPKGATIRLFDEDPDRLVVAASMLKERGYTVQEPALGAAELTQTGPSRSRLWRPSPFLVEALDRIEAHAVAAGAGAGRRALDLACGAGREAVYLALAGWQVDAIDILPDALARAEDLARRCGVAVRTIGQNLRRGPALPRDAYDLVTVFRFLHRPLLPAIAGAVAPGGFVVCETFHRRDAKTGRRRPGAGGGLADGELAAAFEGLDILIARDGEAREGRTFSQLLARKAPPSSLESGGSRR